MATGEGKTLSGALAAAGYVRRGHRVQVMSVNDYLARRDAEWMGPVYDLLGISVGWITQTSTPEERRRAYAADVCYGSASEIGFDVLRDRLATSVDNLVTTEPDVILIDEADSVMVDEGAGAPGAGRLGRGGPIPGRRWPGSPGACCPGCTTRWTTSAATCFLTDAGTRVAEQALGGINLYAEENLDVLTQLNVALHAQALLQRDVGLPRPRRPDPADQRLPRPGGPAASAGPMVCTRRSRPRRGLRASDSGQILDSITIQALVRRYPVGLRDDRHRDGGRRAAAGSFYGLEIAVIPPNLPCVREDEPDRPLPDRTGTRKTRSSSQVAGNARDRPAGPDRHPGRRGIGAARGAE